jgi:hypothetical protein
MLKVLRRFYFRQSQGHRHGWPFAIQSWCVAAHVVASPFICAAAVVVASL